MTQNHASEAPQTVTINLTDPTTVLGSLRQLDSSQRDQVRDGLRKLASEENDLAILRVVKETLAGEFPGREAVGVVFVTYDWENGNFLTEDDAQVLFSDGQTEYISFEGLDRLFTEEFGCRGEKFTLAVDLRDDSLEGDDYSSEETIHAVFGVPKPNPVPDSEEGTEMPTGVGGLYISREALERAAGRKLTDAEVKRVVSNVPDSLLRKAISGVVKEINSNS